MKNPMHSQISKQDLLSFKSPEQVIRILIQCALLYLSDKDNAVEFEKAKQKLIANEQILTKEQFSELMSIVWEILGTFLQSPKDEKNYAKFIKQIMQLSKDPPVSKEFAMSVLESLQSERHLLELKFHEKTTTRLSIKRISYLFDISMEDEDSPAPKPILILDLLLTNGTRRTFRMPFSMFHRLRFATARLLKEISFLETRQIITR